MASYASHFKKATLDYVSWIEPATMDGGIETEFHGFVVPDTSGLIIAADETDREHIWQDGWMIMLSMSGSVFFETVDEIYEFRRKSCGETWPSRRFGLAWVLESGGRKALDVMVAAGIPVHSEDASSISAAMANVEFRWDDNADKFVFTRRAPPKPKKRKMTQKRLDGSEDMTV